MSLALRMETIMRAVVLVVTVGVGVVFLPSAVNVFHLPKATLIVLGALVVAGAASVRFVAGPKARSSRETLGRDPVALTLAGFTLALLVSAVLADDVAEALVGDFGRYAGVAPYLSYAIYFAVAATMFNARGVVSFLRAFVLSAAAVALYGLMQVLEVDPQDYDNLGLFGVFSSMGNPNFASSFLGLAIPAAVWQLADGSPRSRGRGWWWLAAAYLPLGGVVLWRTLSIQGPIIALAGGGVVMGMVLLDRSTRLRTWVQQRRAVRRAGAMIALAALVGALVGATALWGTATRGLGSRVPIYEVAWRLIRDHPIVGVGFGSFGDYFLRLRPVEHGLELGNLTSNTAHSVPLEMFSAGGVLLGFTYLAFVLVIAWILLRNLWLLEGPGRLLLGGVGGVWVSYQLQSLISIDVPALALVHWVSAGCIVAIARQVPGDQPRAPKKARRRSRRGPAVSWTVAAAGLGVIALGALATRPLRADLAAASAVERLNAGDLAGTIRGFERSQELYPAESMYHYLEATSLERAGQAEAAMAAMIDAAEREPGSSHYALFVAKFAQLLERDDEAIRWYLEAASRDPVHAHLLLEIAGRLEELGAVARAVDLYERVVELNGDPQSLERLAELR